MENKGAATSPPAVTQAQVRRQQQQQQQQNGNGVIKLPPGFRFHPTDEELVVHYLIRKALSCPLPASFIPEINLAKFNPWDLPAGSKQDKYLFALREAKYPNGNRANRSTSLGYWKATGRDRAIVASRCNQVVGMKKVLVFYRGKAPNGSRTDWIMHEYRLASQPLNSPHRDWVLCHIFTKKRKTDVEEHQGERAVGFIHFMGTQRGHDSCPSSPSGGSDSSCVTEGMDESSNGEDTSSSSSSSPPP